jgi:hypothetical protein
VTTNGTWSAANQSGMHELLPNRVKGRSCPAVGDVADRDSTAEGIACLLTDSAPCYFASKRQVMAKMATLEERYAAEHRPPLEAALGDESFFASLLLQS